MRILHVNNQVRLGGAETVVSQLRRGFPGAELAVADARGASSEVLSLYPRVLGRLHHSRWHGLMERLAPRDAWTDQTFRRLSRGPWDIIHLHNFHGRYASLEALAELARCKPIVWTFHALWGVTGGCDHPRECRRYLEACGCCPHLGEWPLGLVDNTAAQLEAKVRRLADLPLHVISPSQWMAETVRQSRIGNRWRVHHVPNSVNADFTTALPANRAAKTDAILIANRDFCSEQKGFPVIRAALESVRPSLPNPPVLLLAGENSEWAAESLRGWPCESLGYISDVRMMAALQSRAGIFLFASPAENFPCVILEAMAAGSCVVATPTGGVVEQIDDGVTGLLAREISGPALAEALAKALADPARCRRLGQTARDQVHREFDEEHFFARHREIYAEVLETWRPHA